MANEDLASQEAEGAAVADDAAPDNQGGQQQTDDTPEPIVNLARDLGWSPREEWQGDPEKWKPAEQFIRDGREIQHTTARELRSLREQMDRVAGVTETIVQDRVSAARSQWEADMAKAVEDGDTETALALAKKQPEVKAPNGNAPDSTVQQWIAKNSWFTTHPRAKALATEISDKLARQGFDVATQLSEAEAEVRERYPDLFPKPAKTPPATQTATARNASTSNRQKGFADMPAASQQVARQMVERHPGLTLEAFAKSYWADPANQRSA